jgi:hypothetical protein
MGAGGAFGVLPITGAGTKDEVPTASLPSCRPLLRPQQKR